MDCLIIGFNEFDFAEYERLVRAMGERAGAYRDLALAMIDHQGRPSTSMEVLDRVYARGREAAHQTFSNADFLWPVVLVLGSHLAKHGLSFDYVNLFQREKEELREKLERGRPLTVAITTTLYVSPHPILEIVELVRRHAPEARIVLGGPYMANAPKVMDRGALDAHLSALGADYYVISSEGEHALVELIQALKTGSDLDEVANLAYRTAGGWKLTRAAVERNPLEENRVQYGLFPMPRHGEMLSLRTAKSCPFACSFCGFPQRAGQYTYDDLGLVEAELDSIAELGNVSTLTFLDDTFNVPKKRFRDILKLMIRKGYGFKWNAFYRSDHGDAEIIELMGRAGCEGVFLGIESGSDALLKLMNKTARRQHYLEAIPQLREAGISTYASLIIGFPGETEETIQETVELIEETRPDFFRAQLWYADPATPIWQQRERHGIEGQAFSWRHRTMDADTACYHIDQLFLGVEGSIWLPQYGFEQWSTFYLQRRGMPMERIKTFLRAFNAVIKQRLLFPAAPADPALAGIVEAAARFDEPLAADLAPLEPLRGARYTAAERHLLAESGRAPASAPDAAPTLADATLGREDALRAAWGLLLASLDEGSAAWCLELSQPGFTTVLPWRVEVRWEARFGDFARQLGERCRRGAGHGLLPFHLATHGEWLAANAVDPPRFGAVLAWRAAGLEAEEALARVALLRPEVAAGAGLVLLADPQGERLELVADGLPPGSREELLARLRALLAQGLATPEISLETLLARPEAPAAPTARLAEEAFSFS